MPLIWLIVILASLALLGWLYVVQRKLERESAQMALEQVDLLRERVDHLTRRIQNLEAIAADEDPTLLPESEQELPERTATPAKGRRSRRRQG